MCRKGPHKSGVTGTQRHHQDAFAQSGDVSYIRENQGTASAPEINQIHFFFFLTSEAAPETPCLKSNRKEICVKFYSEVTCFPNPDRKTFVLKGQEKNKQFLSLYVPSNVIGICFFFLFSFYLGLVICK